jgi:hypothetical protein
MQHSERSHGLILKGMIVITTRRHRSHADYFHIAYYAAYIQAGVRYRAWSGCESCSYGSIRVVDHGVAGVVGEEAEVGVGEVEETVDAVVDFGLDGDETVGEVGVAALPIG